MYAYIKGEVTQKGVNFVVIDVGGIGYEIFADTFTINSLTAGEIAKLFTYLKVTQDDMVLYGFHTAEQKKMFEKLIAINGVGPKAAISILCTLRVNDIAAAVISNDDKVFLAANGIGKKTAQRLVLELKEKVDFDMAASDGEYASYTSDATSEAVAALIGLGYNRQEALSAVAAVKSLGDTAEELVGLALKKMI